MRRDPRAYLWDIQQGCLNVQSFLYGISLAEYQCNLLLRSAVERQLHNIVEALAQLARLGACRAWGVASEKRSQRAQFLPDLQAHSSTMGQKAGKKWTAAAVSQPTIPKSDRLLDPELAARVPEYRQIIGFRNVLVHGYATLNHDEVWRAIGESLPPLQSAANALLASLGAEDPS